ncbi:hypothetical protein J9303_20275, partial [Bacillaceae bacterium Marseille-Q3522]|nr:hypothetical protein [Bacillaceae bacterium Marseille-Q3522]
PIVNKNDLFKMVNKFFFNNWINGDLLTFKPEVKPTVFTSLMQSIFLQSKYALYDFFAKGTSKTLKPNIDQITIRLIVEQISKNVASFKSIKEAYNLRIALLKYFHIEGGEKMADQLATLASNLKEKLGANGLVTCQSENEFYYLSGQLAFYLLYQSESSNRNMGMFETILRVKYASQLKKRLDELLLSYGHAINMDAKKFRNAFSSIMGFETSSKVEGINRELLLAGLLSDNVFLQKKTEEM